MMNNMATVEHRYVEYGAMVLRKLNKDLASPEMYREKRVIFRIAMLILTEAYCSPFLHLKPESLRHHLQGLVTVIAARGGMRTRIENGQLNATIFTTVLITIVVTNTTSPAHDQMLGDVLTNMDVYIHYAEISMSLFPCPTHLFLCIKDINHLRHQISAASTIQPAAIKAAMETILSRIAAFDPLRWRECYTMPPPATLQSAGPPYSALLCSRIHRRGARDNCSAAVDFGQRDNCLQNRYASIQSRWKRVGALGSTGITNTQSAMAVDNIVSNISALIALDMPRPTHRSVP
ncbi:hypothetical protein NQ176_g7340 [Zarea fungicola]|uniref:Uncharacterized protein n=1 Tax=Zarea fungicola TaxID=93591 RepID=A0ACC1MZ69_9HYPO|nr:hypothetical protein NQ176_g7340 [Lecanicillium fungicola]